MMLVYDPAGRMSAKQACNHPYLEDMGLILRGGSRPVDPY